MKLRDTYGRDTKQSHVHEDQVGVAHEKPRGRHPQMRQFPEAPNMLPDNAEALHRTEKHQTRRTRSVDKV